MSIMTTFKRTALVAVVSLGLGFLSAVPSNATYVAETATISTTNGVAVTTGGKSDTGNATVATVTLKFAVTSASDTATLSFLPTAKPSDAATQYLRIYQGTVTETMAGSVGGGTSPFAIGVDTSASTGNTVVKTFTQFGGGTISASDTSGITTDANTTAAATFQVYLESSTGTRTAGTYTFRAILRVFNASAAMAVEKSADLSIVVAGQAKEATAVNAANSTAYLGSTSGELSSDAVVTASSTASNTPVAFIQVKLRNTAGTGTANESVTVTTTLGQVGVSGGTFGRSVVLSYTGSSTNDSMSVWVRADGSVGTATITVSTPSASFPNKQVTFFGSMTGGSIVATQNAKTIKVGSNSSAITVNAKDSSGNLNGSSTAILIYSSNTAVISETATACSFSSSLGVHTCTLTGVAAGTADITIGTAGKTVVSAAMTVTVTNLAAAKVSLAFNKSSYVPGEKGYVIVSATDSAGKPIAGTVSNLLAAGGISSTVGLTSVGGGISTLDSLTTSSVSPELKWTTASGSGYASLDPVYVIPFYAPQTSGEIKISATGGTGLPVAGQVAVSATSKVVNSADDALAAVTALASQVSAFITKINAQITTLTDLVMKIQKKVKA